MNGVLVILEDYVKKDKTIKGKCRLYGYAPAVWLNYYRLISEQVKKEKEETELTSNQSLSERLAATVQLVAVDGCKPLVSQPRFDRKNISMDWVIPVNRRQKWREITHKLLAA